MNDFAAFFSGLLFGIFLSLVILFIVDEINNCNYPLWLGDKSSTQASVINQLIENPQDSLVVEVWNKPFPIGIIRFEPTP